ncbi:hypothetical protein VNO77_35466 [Canavalia gladiata]|uniref:Uncharacterized protein n=1 Tax=Canavalia gladiata TaxID=3824 RepID=A0AAN9KFD6_CANGL
MTLQSSLPLVCFHCSQKSVFILQEPSIQLNKLRFIFCFKTELTTTTACNFHSTNSSIKLTESEVDKKWFHGKSDFVYVADSLVRWSFFRSCNPKGGRELLLSLLIFIYNILPKQITCKIIGHQMTHQDFDISAGIIHATTVKVYNLHRNIIKMGAMRRAQLALQKL